MPRLKLEADHEIDPEYVPICMACGRNIEWSDTKQEWVHY